MEKEIRNRLTAVMMRIRGDHPFFGTLALFAEFHINDQFETAATNGKDIWINPAFISGFDDKTFSGILVHELLHAALQHGERRKERDALLWNIAADVVVNGIILNDTNYELPKGAVIDMQLCDLCVEDIYEQLLTNKIEQPKLTMIDLIESKHDEELSEQQRRDKTSYWSTALYQASAIARKSDRGYGCNGLGLSRDIDESITPTLNWKELLWQHVISTPSDYSGFDRRFVGQGLYLDDIVGETVQIAIAIDTSGSVNLEELTEFVSEIQGMLDAYPHLQAQLFYVDTNLYGPYEFSMIEEIPRPKGGGGTSFVKFFKYVMKHHSGGQAPVCVYFTDGYGEFPDKEPECEVIWVINSGGIESRKVPFGQVIRLRIGN